MEVELHKGERIDQLFSQDVAIIQSKEVFSFSIDAVLLAHFAKLPLHGEIVDLCAGNGAVSLFMSRKTKAKITGIEIQSRLAEMARRSVILNDLEDQVQIIEDDLACALVYFKKGSVDVVTCNPPYFKKERQGKTNPNAYLAIARHELKTNLTAVLKTSADLLKTNGAFYMVHRPDRLLEILEEMQKVNLMPKEIQFVYPKRHKDANMILIKGIKEGKKVGLKILSPLYVHDEAQEYSKEVAAILYEH